MYDFLVLWDNGLNRPAYVLKISAPSEEILRDKFPTAIRIIRIG